MKVCKQVFALLLTLCLILPMALVNVSAEVQIDNSGYKLFHPSLTSLKFNGKGQYALANALDSIKTLYNNGELDMTPMYWNTDDTSYLSYGVADTSNTFPFDGFKCQRAVLGDWVAFKFRSPGEGLFSVAVDIYYLNDHLAAGLSGYLLPARTAEASIPSLLTDENKIGVANISPETPNKTEASVRLTPGVELKANTEYLLVLQATSDAYDSGEDRIDLMITGLTFGEGYELDPNAFGPVTGETVVEGPVQYAQYSRVLITGVNPVDGHDLIYMMFKGGTMIVYDIDANEIYDVEENMAGTPANACIDPEGNFWSCGSNAAIFKYDPRTKRSEKYSLSYSMFEGEKRASQGIVYGDDGYLYFTYYCWLVRMDPKTGNVERISDALTTNPDPSDSKLLGSDAQFAGYGGIIYRDGYLYTTLHGDLNQDLIMTSQVIKYDIANRKIVQAIDIRDTTWGDYQSSYGVYYLDCVGDVLFCTLSGRPDVPAYIDISGDEMVRLDKLGNFDSNIISRFTGEMNGKYYVTGYVDAEESGKCLYEYDPATMTMTRLGDIHHPATLFSRGGIVTVENDSKLPGESIVTALNNAATGKVDLVFYNLQTGETVIWEGVSGDYGSPAQLHSLALDPTGQYLYTGAYGTNKLVRIDLNTGDMTEYFTHAHQVDGMIWYEDYLWVGNYDMGTITKFDPITGEIVPLFELMNSVFQNKRVWNFSAGDGKVFCGLVPDTGRFGGVLVWYDMEHDLTYVAAGPNPEDVFYADTTASFVVWKNAVTGEIETFDENGDGIYDYDLLVDDKGTADPDDDVYKQRYYGVVENRVLISTNYVDGYIIGSTSKYNGQNTVPGDSEGNAELFVYDVSARKLVATYDLTDAIDGLINPMTGFVDTIDVVRPDPYEKGKFWGFVCDTLFSFTFDFATNTFQVKEELSLGKDVEHKITSYGGREILFDGDYLYVPFHNAGMYMVNTANPAQNYQVTSFTTDKMLQLPNGDIVYIGGADGSKYGIRKLTIAEYTQPLAAASVQAVIDGLPETVTMENEEQFVAAYKMYLDLSEEAKALVNADKLTGAAETMNPQLAAKADALIDAIGEVTLEKEAAIREARNYYNYLPEPAKALVTKLSVLEDAEDKLFELKQPKPTPDPKPTPEPAPKNNTLTVVIIAVAAAVVIAAAVVAVILIRKKKKQ